MHYEESPCDWAITMPKARKSAFDPTYVEIVDLLAARRRELGMTQADLAAAYGEDQSFIRRVERRQRRIDVYENLRFCRALQIHPSVILDPIYERELD